MLRVFVITSDKYLWALQPFSFLFNIYWSTLQPVVVAGYQRPKQPLPSNFNFIQLDTVDYPPEKWSDGLIRFLRAMDDDWFVLLLEDYWLCRTADTSGIATLYEYVKDKKDVLRLDLTADRLYAGSMFDLESWGHYDIIETPCDTPYQMSLQAGIWNRRLMLNMLQPGKSAWETEIHLHPPDGMRVLGTRQLPLKYANAILKGKLDPKQLQYIPVQYQQTVFRMIPKEWIEKGD